MSAWKIREATESDWAFIGHSWVETMRGALPHTREYLAASDPAVEAKFREYWRRVTSECLARRDTITMVAVDAEDPETIYGFYVQEPGVPRMAYVRGVWRKLGVAKELMAPMVLNRQRVTDWCNRLARYAAESESGNEIVKHFKRWRKNGRGEGTENQERVSQRGRSPDANPEP